MSHTVSSDCTHSASLIYHFQFTAFTWWLHWMVLLKQVLLTTILLIAYTLLVYITSFTVSFQIIFPDLHYFLAWLAKCDKNIICAHDDDASSRSSLAVWLWHDAPIHSLAPYYSSRLMCRYYNPYQNNEKKLFNKSIAKS